MGDEPRVLQRAVAEAEAFFGGLRERPVNARSDVDQVAADLGRPLADAGEDALVVLEELIAGASPGLLGSPSGRFFGWVIGGVLPAALGADWLTAVWDQNAGLLASSPAAAGAERVAGGWVLDLLGLPSSAAVGFVTGAMMANFTCLAAARRAVYRDVGWDVDRDGLVGAAPVTVVVGAERHDTVDAALRYLGLGHGTAVVVPADEQGRLRVDALSEALEGRSPGPLIVCLQAGNVNSGAFDPLGEATDVVHQHGGWVHVDGAFGLWAAASPTLRHLTNGLEQADSWTTDAHKTLNVPYDCGIAIVKQAGVLYEAMGVHAAYLIQDERPDPLASVPEFSRRARGFPAWAALRSLGRNGVAELVERFCAHARRFAALLGEIDDVQVVNEVVFTQVCVTFGSDQETREVVRRLLLDGTAWMTPSFWQGQAILRISISNWRTTDADVERTIDAVRRVVQEVRTADRSAR
jgi:glutamate/tyrosine decarboxylase-like PLP-dependent enzyme